MSPDLQQIQSPDPQRRAAAAAALGKSRGYEAVSALIRALRDPEPVVQRAALTALGSTRDPRAIHPLNIMFCSTAVPELRRLAGSTLAELGEQGLACVALASRSADPDLRGLAEEVRASSQHEPGFAARWEAAGIEAGRITAANADPHRWDGMPGLGQGPARPVPAPSAKGIATPAGPTTVFAGAPPASPSLPGASPAPPGLLGAVVGVVMIIVGAQVAIWGGLAVLFVAVAMSQGDFSGIAVLIVMGLLSLLGLGLMVFGLRRVARPVIRALRELWRLARPQAASGPQQ